MFRKDTHVDCRAKRERFSTARLAYLDNDVFKHVDRCLSSSHCHPLTHSVHIVVRFLSSLSPERQWIRSPLTGSFDFHASLLGAKINCRTRVNFIRRRTSSAQHCSFRRQSGRSRRDCVSNSRMNVKQYSTLSLLTFERVHTRLAHRRIFRANWPLLT